METIRVNGRNALNNAVIKSGLMPNSSMLIEINGTNERKYEINCEIDNICVIRCLSRQSCTKLRLLCAGTCYVECNGDNIECPVNNGYTQITETSDIFDDSYDDNDHSSNENGNYELYMAIAICVTIIILACIFLIGFINVYNLKHIDSISSNVDENNCNHTQQKDITIATIASTVVNTNSNHNLQEQMANHLEIVADNNNSIKHIDEEPPLPQVVYESDNVNSNNAVIDQPEATSVTQSDSDHEKMYNHEGNDGNSTIASAKSPSSHRSRSSRDIQQIRKSTNGESK